MELPQDVLAIIKEYAQPITRPGWRNLHKMTSYTFHSEILYKYNHMRNRKWMNIIYNFVREYTRNPQDIYIYSFYDVMDYNRFVSIVHLRLKN